MIKQFFIAIGIAVAFCACSTNKFLSDDEMKAFILLPENGVNLKREIRDLKINLLYKPKDLLVAQELRKEKQVDSSFVTTLRNKYGNSHYFTLSMSRNGKEVEYGAMEGFAKFTDLLQTMSFRMQEYVYLTTSDYDTIPLGNYVYPRTYGQGQASMLLLSFDNKKTHGDEWIDLHLREFGLGIGNQKFKFDMDDIHSIPAIDFQINI